MATVGWTRTRPGALDTATGATAAPVVISATIDATGIFSGMTPLKFAAGTLQLMDARKLLVAGLAMDPYEVEPGDVWTFEGADWTTYDIKRLAPDGGAAILFTVFVSRGGA
jgi:hypothetical protein